MVEKNGLKKYKLSKMKVMLLWFNNWELGESISDSIKFSKFLAIDKFASDIVNSYDKKEDFSNGFCFNLVMDSVSEVSLKHFLLNQKKFVLNYIVSQECFRDTHLYQLYLQYIPYELTNIEKCVLLSGYLNMMSNIKGSDYSVQKRKCLERNLHIY